MGLHHRIRGKKIRTSNRAHRHAAAPSCSHYLVAVAAYRPNPPGTGGATVWAQHRIYFTSIGRMVDPRKAFVDDLSKEIVNWRNAGCEVILGLDANEDLSVVDSQSFRYQLRQVGPDEAILARHNGTLSHSLLMASSHPLAFQCWLAVNMSLMSSSPRIIGDCGSTLISRHVWGIST